MIDLDIICSKLAASNAELEFGCKMCIYPDTELIIPETITHSFRYTSAWFRSKPTVGSWPIQSPISLKPIFLYYTSLVHNFSGGISYIDSIPVAQSYGDKELCSLVAEKVCLNENHLLELPYCQSLIYLASSRWSQSNYWHWLLDCLPKILVFFEYSVYTKTKVLHLPSGLTNPYHQEWISKISLLAEEKGVPMVEKAGWVNYQNVLYCPSLSLPRPNPFLPVLLRKYADMFFPCNLLENKNSRVLILRKKNTQRATTNTDQLISWALENNFRSVFLENLTVYQQIDLFRSANTVIGLHGAGLANIVFMKPGGTVIELTPSSGYNPSIQELAASNSLQYGVVPFKSDPITQCFNVDILHLTAILSLIGDGPGKV